MLNQRVFIISTSFIKNKSDFIVSQVNNVQSRHFGPNRSVRWRWRQKQIQVVKITDNVRNEAINQAHPSVYSWCKFREARSRSLHNLTVLSQIWTCLLLHPPVCPSVCDSDCLQARRPTSCLVCLRAFLPDCLFWFASLHLVTKFICAIPKQPAPSPVNLHRLYLSDTQQPLQASVRMGGSKKKEKKEAVLHRHYKNPSPISSFLCCLVKMFKGIAGLKTWLLIFGLTTQKGTGICVSFTCHYFGFNEYLKNRGGFPSRSDLTKFAVIKTPEGNELQEVQFTGRSKGFFSHEFLYMTHSYNFPQTCQGWVLTFTVFYYNAACK